MKVVPTFKSHKTIRNCNWCIAFWCALVVCFSVGSLSDELIFRASINLNNYEDKVIRHDTLIKSNVSLTFLKPIHIKSKEKT